MKKRILVFVALMMLLVLGLAGTAPAEEYPISMKIGLSQKRFSGPTEITVTISVSNTTGEDLPGPMALVYPDSVTIVEDFGKPTLAAGQTKTWEGTWTVTEEEIKSGQLFFYAVYPYTAEDGSIKHRKIGFYTPIEEETAITQVEISRHITPSMAGNGQKVSVIYEVANTGTVDVTDVVIKESTTVAKNNGRIALVKPGEKQTYTFTVTMGKKDLTSSGNITYKANGKTYTETVAKQTIKYGDVKLSATLAADKKGGNPGDTVKLTLTLKNAGKTNYENITVTDPTLGTVFTGLSVEAGKSVTEVKEITISQSTSYQFTMAGTISGTSMELTTDPVAITAVDPGKAVALTVTATADKPTIYMLPDVVKFTVTVQNTSAMDAEKVTVSASGVDLYTFDRIPAGESRSFVRDVRVEMAGSFRFDARVKNQLEETDTFSSALLRITHARPTAAPTMVPIPMPVMPEMEKLPTSDGLPPYVDTIQQVLGIGQWVFLGIGAAALVLILVGAVGRAKNAAQSAKASDHLDRDGYRDYTQAVSSRKRHVMPEEDSTQTTAAETAPDVPAEPVAEAPSAEIDNTDAVNDAMAKLYPEATDSAENAEPNDKPAEATYTRRRRSDED